MLSFVSVEGTYAQCDRCSATHRFVGDLIAVGGAFYTLFLRADSPFFDAFHGGANNFAWLQAYRITERAVCALDGEGNAAARARLEHFLRDNVDIVAPNPTTGSFADEMTSCDAIVVPLVRPRNGATKLAFETYS